MYLIDVEKKNILFWAITLSNGKHIGNIKIDPIDYKHKNGEYGIMMGDKFEWGKGYAREASQLVIDYCFENLNLNKLTLGVIEENKQAIKLYKKLNFNEEGKLIRHVIKNKKFYNVLRMALFNKNFKF